MLGIPYWCGMQHNARGCLEPHYHVPCLSIRPYMTWSDFELIHPSIHPSIHPDKMAMRTLFILSHKLIKKYSQKEVWYKNVWCPFLTPFDLEIVFLARVIVYLSFLRFWCSFESKKKPNNAEIRQSLIVFILLVLASTMSTILIFGIAALFGIFSEKPNIKTSWDLGGLSCWQ